MKFYNPDFHSVQIAYQIADRLIQLIQDITQSKGVYSRCLTEKPFSMEGT